jgi:hypothetical protein
MPKLPVLMLSLPVAAIALLAGCSSTPSSPDGTPASVAATASTSLSASSAPSAAASASVSASVPASPASATPVATGAGASPSGAKVYFAESGDVAGTALYRPSCAADCVLSGDSTALLRDMTWQTWTATEAVGSGTEKVDDCQPNCAAGTLHPVRVTVTFTKPVKAGCSAATTRLYWTRAALTWPDGLPAALSGQNAPTNLFVYSQIGGTSACG